MTKKDMTKNIWKELLIISILCKNIEAINLYFALMLSDVTFVECAAT